MMKQQCWRELRQQMCSKEMWIKDEQQTKCQHCSKEFIPIVRRRHHCRFCGNIFCSSCSDFFLNGKYLGLSDKFIRHCEFCHQKIQKFIKDCARMPQVLYQQEQCNNYSQDQQEEEQFFDLTQEDPQPFNLNKFFGQNQQKLCSQMITKLDEQIKNKIENIAHNLCQKFGFDSSTWLKKLSDIAFKAAIQTKMDSFTSEGPYESSMDIIKQVKIKTLLTEPDKITAILLKGIVLQKNLPSKHMPTHLSKPTILLIQNSIDIESFSQQMKFQDLMKNQKLIMNKIFDRISKLSPDIIFVEGNVNVQAIECFQEKKICVVSKIKKKDLQLVKEVGNVKKSVKKLWLLQKYKPQNILGVCDKIYFKTIKQGHTLMFIQSDVGIRTIILGEHTEELAACLKRSMQLLLRYSRQINLEKNLITVDNQASLTLLRSLKFPFFTQLNAALYQTPELFSASQQITYTMMALGETKRNDAPKMFVEYGEKMGKYMFYFNCDNPVYEKKKIYSAGDITLGGYLLLNIALNEKGCKKCQKVHAQRYYFKNNVVTIRFNKKVSNVNNVKSSFADLNLQNNEEILTLERLKGALKKQKSKLIIQTYICCQICLNQMTLEPIKVGKNYLENSFFYFLSLLDKVNSQFQAKQGSKEKVSRSGNMYKRKQSMEKCTHGSLIRVFQYSGSMVKFSIHPIHMHTLFEINLKTEEGRKIVSNNEKKYLQKLKQTQLRQKQGFLQEIYSIINRFSFLTNSSSFSLSQSVSSSSSMKVIEKMERFQKAYGILQNLANQFQSFKSEEMSEDWTLFMRNLYKYEYTMKVLYQIMEFFQNYILKKKLDQKSETENTFDDLERIDGNSPQSEIDTQSNTTKDLSYSHISLTMSSSTLFGIETKERKESEADSKSHKIIKRIRKERYPKYEGIFLKYSIGYTFSPVSILACALNSPQFLTVHTQNRNKEVLNFKLQFNSKIKTSYNLKQQVDSVYKELFENDSLTNRTQTYEITIYFPDQFERLRVREGVNFETYVRSLCGCESWDSSGGKSNSSFAKSHNEILVVKIINNKEFVQFKKFAQDYLKYIERAKMDKKDSLLAKIYGIYEISMRGKEYRCVVMQNLFFGIQNITKVYDLKGSEVNRLTIPESQKSYTGQDTNFKIDKDNDPYILEGQDYERIVTILQSDANFLKESEVIDYSLLAIEFCHQGKNNLRLGIIDFMRPYHILQKIENMYKKAKMGNNPTVIPPENYAERFFSAMQKYFIKVN